MIPACRFARDHGLMAAKCQDYAYGHDHDLGTCEITPLADNVKLNCIGVASATLPQKGVRYSLDSMVRSYFLLICLLYFFFFTPDNAWADPA